MGGMFSRDVTGDIQYLEAERAALQETEAQILATLEAKESRYDHASGQRDALHTHALCAAPCHGRQGKARCWRDSGRTEAEAVRRLIAELEFEHSLLRVTDEQRRAAIVSREAGAAATDEERARIIALNEALHQERDALERNEEAMEEFGNFALDGVSMLTDAINTGNDALDQFLQTLNIMAVAQAALLGEGPLAKLFGGGSGILGSLFGGGFKANTTASAFFTSGFSSGTANTGGQRGQPRGIVHGQEAVIPLPSGGRVPVQLQGGGQGSGGSQPVQVSVDVGVSVDTDGNLQAYVKNVAQTTSRDALAHYDKGNTVRVANGVKEATRRRMLR